MAKVRRFEDLDIWKESKILVLQIYNIFRESKDYGFRDQICRASVSVMNNIAEGFERESDKEFQRFLYISKASSGEVRSMLYLASDLNYISVDNAKELIISYEKLSSKLYSLIQYLHKNN